MRFLFLIVFLCFSNVSQAVTLGVYEVYQALSLTGTDVDAQPEGFVEPVQAKVMSRPFVVSGALPEALVESVAAPHELPATGFYKEKEANIAVLCNINLKANMTRGSLIVEIDTTALNMPETVDLSAEQAVMLIISAIQETLRVFYQDPNAKAPRCRVEVSAKEEHVYLTKLSKTLSL